MAKIRRVIEDIVIYREDREKENRSKGWLPGRAVYRGKPLPAVKLKKVCTNAK